MNILQTDGFKYKTSISDLQPRADNQDKTDKLLWKLQENGNRLDLPEETVR